ncbi:MAG TPA: multicopper oxidase domain-containing protein [Nocardioides sp.]|uniref:multicopper oxidase family protein n=1 Tax=Nocardioides sp. TaxID=35761 RepID=UPI002D7E9E62|nr:multicopper oxidase domain-containing protein [Nocardioides sp.]HET6654198.1 multicopper oxidase domain-containing protein [Nocardioides sp.]
MQVSRRGAIQLGGLGVLAVGGLSVPWSGAVLSESASELDQNLLPTPYQRPFAVPPVLLPRETGQDEFGRYATFVINEQAATAQVLPSGQLLRGFGYDGTIPGPTIHVERGTRVVAKLRNRLPLVHPQFGHRFDTSTHLHGNPSLPEYDGYASDLTGPGSSKVYQWPTEQTGARTLWYHDHAVHRTAENVYSGLAGQFHVHSPVERALLPTQSPYDVPLIVSDVMFAGDGSLGFDTRDDSGLWGDVILVNGVPWPVMPVRRRVYRFRMLDASLSRSYRPTLFPAGIVHMVATDGGLMPRSQAVTSWRHGSAERYEFLIDFSQYPAGTRVELRNLSNENNRDFDHTDKILAFDVTDQPVDTSDPTWNVIPDTLFRSDVMDLTPDMAVRHRLLAFEREGGEWTINGRTWDDVIDSGFREVVGNPGLGDVEVWTYENGSGGWFHPVHMHLVDQKILSRNGNPPFDYEAGPKDTIYVGENETVDIIMRFGPHRGRYMIHCHNLPHEDHDMMVQFSVGLAADAVDPHDPIGADPASRDDDDDRGRSPDPWPPGVPRRPSPGNSGPGSGSSGPGSGGSGGSGSSNDDERPKKRRNKKPKKKPGKKGKGPKGKGPKGKGPKGKKGKGPRGKGGRPPRRPRRR